jgi:hypothetical protein
MSRRVLGYTVVAAAIAAVLWLFPASAAAQRGGRGGAAQAPDNAPTPRDAAGHPDLTGLYGGGGGGGGDDAAGGDNDTGEIIVNLNARGGTPVNFERDNHLTRRINLNVPMYKPQYWEKVRELNDDGSAQDPSYSCMPGGVPRMGPPAEIIQLPNKTVFLYGGWGFQVREIPTDGRPHSKNSELEGTWMGEGLGSWDGDTFVVDSIGFTDASWLGIQGFFHSEHMHVVERFKRTGNTIAYDVTVEDPDVLLMPYKIPTRMMRVNPNPRAYLTEGLPCSEKDLSHLVSKENH